MKIVATGGTGMVGSYLPDYVAKTNRSSLNVQDSDVVKRFLTTNRPDAVIHLAAETNVDHCELNEEHAFAVNALGTLNVARWCGVLDIPLVYVSSAQVFNGEKDTAYHEFDQPSPRTVYGKSKLAGEDAVRQFAKKAWIIRASWMIGGGPNGDKKFIAKMLDHAKVVGEIRAVDDKFGSLTYVPDMLRVIEALVIREDYGTIHVASNGSMSRYDIALRVRDVLDLDFDVVPVSSATFDLPAPRGRSEVLESMVLPSLGLGATTSWQTTLDSYLKEEWVAG